MDSVLIDHIKDAKYYIGANFTSLRHRALELNVKLEELIDKAQYIIATHSNPIESRMINRGFLRYGPQRVTNKLEWF